MTWVVVRPGSTGEVRSVTALRKDEDSMYIDLGTQRCGLHPGRILWT